MWLGAESTLNWEVNQKLKTLDLHVAIFISEFLRVCGIRSLEVGGVERHFGGVISDAVDDQVCVASAHSISWCIGIVVIDEPGGEPNRGKDDKIIHLQATEN